MLRILLLTMSWCVIFAPVHSWRKLGCERRGRAVLTMCVDAPRESPEVKFIMKEIAQVLRKSAGAGASTGAGAGVTMTDVECSFDALFEGIASNEHLTYSEKLMLQTESSLALQDVRDGGDDNALASAVATEGRRLGGVSFRTELYSQKISPTLLVHGPGPVGQACLAVARTMRENGDADSFRLLDASNLASVPEAELWVAVRDAKAIIVAADNTAPASRKASGGFFGALTSGTRDAPFVVNGAALKRILNAARQDRNNGGTNALGAKVVVLERAYKMRKSVASLLTGDTMELGAEAVLQCKQRGLPYAVVKVGMVVTEDGIPPNKRQHPTVVADGPVLFTRSRVEATDVTTVDTAMQALMRSASHPQTNSTISVLSLTPGMATDAQWDDEFLRLDGPELARVALESTASPLQVSIWLGRIVKELCSPDSGLITPIEVERCADGVRILFVPNPDGYQSVKEEKAVEKKQQQQSAASAATKGSSSKKVTGGYISPEMERENPELAATSDAAQVQDDENEQQQQQKRNKLHQQEGGLEVIMEAEPFRRVRIRRCNIGPNTVVKEQSEALILEALLTGIRRMEVQYADAIISRKQQQQQQHQHEM